MTNWEEPTFTEISMSAEIGSYQEDFDRDHEGPAFVSGATTATEDSESNA